MILCIYVFMLMLILHYVVCVLSSPANAHTFSIHLAQNSSNVAVTVFFLILAILPLKHILMLDSHVMRYAVNMNVFKHIRWIEKCIFKSMDREIMDVIIIIRWQCVSF